MSTRQNGQTESRWRHVWLWGLVSIVAGLAVAGCSGSGSDTPSDTPPTTETSGAPMPLQTNQTCQVCHERQYQETLQSVKSGYRSISPAFNTLELAGNFLAQPALEAERIRNNLRPSYGAEEDIFNMVSADEGYNNPNDARGAFCIGCHDAAIVLLGEDPEQREIPEWQGRFDPNPPPGTLPAILNARPLRDFHFIDAAGEQMMPNEPGGPPPEGAMPSLGSQGALCDHCHNVQGAAFQRSLLGDGFANTSQDLEFTRIKVGPFNNAKPVGPLPDGSDSAQNFHSASSDPDRIRYMRSSLFCIACHDVRVPNPDLVAPEANREAAPGDNANNSPVQYFRLENLGTEWATQAYAFPDQNPFNQKVRCQDCHMSLYPFTEDDSYTVNDPESGLDFPVTSPRPAPQQDVFPVNKAAVSADPSVDVTDAGIEVPDRQVVTHYFTGIDVPLVYTDCAEAAADPYGRTDACVGELRERLGADRVSTFEPGEDVHHLADGRAISVPVSLQTRREHLLNASTRLYLNLTDDTATLGETFHVRATVVALTGHNFPAGFSQERTTWIELKVTAPLSADSASICNNTSFVRVAGESQFCDNGEFILYQSGYRIDRPHPETEEMMPDGWLDDEDTSHLIAVVNPFNHHNEIFYEGPDAGPLERIFFGEPRGLVLFRNELLRIYGPKCLPFVPDQDENEPCPAETRETNIPPTNRRHPRTGAILEHVLEEETFSAGAANSVDNWRSIPPLDPQTYVYEFELPTPTELAELGIRLDGPLHVRASIHFLHFPPLFLRFLTRVGGSVAYALPPAPDDRAAPYNRVANFDHIPQNGYTNAVGLRGPANHDFRLFDEKRIDDLLRNVPDIAEAERCIPLDNFACPATPSTAQLSGQQAARKSNDIKEEPR